jgi:hypothetical protein
VGLSINDQLVTAVGEEFGVLARPLDGPFVDWRAAIPAYTGYWVVDKEALVETLKDAQALLCEHVRLVVDSIADQLIITARGPQGDTYRRALTAHRKGGPPMLRCAVDPRFLLYAVDSTEGGLVRLGFDDQEQDHKPITVRGEDDDFLAVLAPCRTA